MNQQQSEGKGMAIYTTLSKKDIAKIADEFVLGDL
jgi:hypothetical protein